MSLQDQLKRILGDSDEEEHLNNDHYFTEKGASRKHRVANWLRAVRINQLVAMHQAPPKNMEATFQTVYCKFKDLKLIVPDSMLAKKNENEVTYQLKGYATLYNRLTKSFYGRTTSSDFFQLVNSQTQAFECTDFIWALMFKRFPATCTTTTLCSTCSSANSWSQRKLEWSASALS